MDRFEPQGAQIIPFPQGTRGPRRRLAAAAMQDHDLTVRAEVDACSAWYHQAAMLEASAPRRP